MSDKNYNKMTKNELILKCKELNIKKYSLKTKIEIIDLIKSNEKNINNINIDEENKKEENIDEENKKGENIDKENKKGENIDEENKKGENIDEENKKGENKNERIEIKNMDGIKYLESIKDNSIDLILTDPPYIISKESGMNEHYNNVKTNEENNIEYVKSEDEWEQYKKNNGIEGEVNKDKYLKYGTIYGKKYCVKTDYGEWDVEFTIEKLEKYIKEYYKKLKNGGTIIIFFDIWKIGILKDLLEKYNYKQIRFIEWIKTNPQPRNSKINYLTNCREVAVVGVKSGNPTFNSSYDNGIYNYPLQGGKNRFHPTQKNINLFEELIKKHSNENDVILDTFLGSGTTAIACKNTKRQFKGCEISKEYYDKIKL